MTSQLITIEQSSAFIETFTTEPTRPGPLDGLTFAVKDIIDIGGRKTGCGNPDWRDSHPPAAANAVCVDQVLAAGARCLGKTVTSKDLEQIQRLPYSHPACISNTLPHFLH